MSVKWNIFISMRTGVTDPIRTPAPRRSPASGGYARGGETRARIINAGLKVFGEDGYDRASTRRIAEVAGVTPPALQYYFESKDGLHRACAEYIVETVMALLDPALEAAESALAEPDPKTAIEALCDVLDALVDASMFSKDSPDWARFSARVQAEDDSPSGPLIQSRLIGPIRNVAIRLVASARERPVSDDIRLRASVILNQVSVFYAHREPTLRALGWPDFNGARRDAVKAVLRAHTRGALSCG